MILLSKDILSIYEYLGGKEYLKNWSINPKIITN